MRILILNGPNMQLLGTREPEIYGAMTYNELVDRLESFGRQLDCEVVCLQSNHEGELVDAIAGSAGVYDGIVINPAAYSHSSLAIHDALKAVAIPAIEVHVSHVFSRESIRSQLVTAPACTGLIAGFGTAGYELAIRALKNRV